MLNKFPEIIYFFSRDSFTQEDLDTFKTNIERIYDKSTAKFARALIELNVTKFKMGFEVKNQKHILTNSTEKKTKQIQPKKINRVEQFESNLFQEFYGKVIILDITDIASKLNVSFSQFQNVLKYYGIEKKENEFLSEEEFHKIDKFILQRLKSIRKNLRDQKNILRTKSDGSRFYKQRSFKSSGVYDQIVKHGGLGKIIYNRMK